jgi:alkylated DNA repair dioxygenase AlkB
MEFNLKAVMERAMKKYTERVVEETTKQLLGKTEEKEYIIQTERSALTIETYTNKRLIDQCVEEIRGKVEIRPPIKVFKATEQPRNVGFFSNESKGYGYSKQFMAAQPLTAGLTELLADVNRKCGMSTFNGILVNEYMNGLDKIGAHSDDERGVDIIGGVVAISWGATRKFRIKSKSDKKIVATIPTTPYSLIRMSGRFQEDYTHEIPEEPKITEKRISFTFRTHTH